MNTEKTAAELLCEIAAWVKKQNPEFTKNFKYMRSIIHFYKELPEDYDRKKSITEYIRKNMKGHPFSVADRLSLITNSLFGFRYFKKAPYKWKFRFGLNRYSIRDKEYIEVRGVQYDRCCCYIGDNLFKPVDHSGYSISINSLGDAKRAADQLLASFIRSTKPGDDYEVEYTDNLKKAMKKSKPTDDVLTEGIDVYL